MRNYNVLFPNGKSKCFTLSYDDGVHTDIRLGELMKKHGVAGTFNINSGMYLAEDSTEQKPTRRLKLSEALEFYKSSPLFEVATHGYMHPSTALVPIPLGIYDVIADRRTLEEQFGKMIRGHAYPNGSFNQSTVDILKLCGIVYARTTKSTRSFDMPKDWLVLNPTCHHNDPELFELCDRFLNGDTTPNNPIKLFYVWGHSYEFEKQGNWDVIEALLERVGGHDNVWYATNIEIYEYMQAYYSLIFSADATRVYNPTDKDVWIGVCKKYPDRFKVKIPAGKTVEIKDE